MTSQFNPDNYVVFLETTNTSILKALFERLATNFSECPVIFLPMEKDEGEPDEKFYDEMDSSDESQKVSKPNKTGGIRIHQLTISGSIMVKVNLHASKFDKFICSEKLTVCVEVTLASKAISTISDNDILIMSIMKNDLSTLRISAVRNTQDDKYGGNKDITINLTDPKFEKIHLGRVKPQRRMVMTTVSFMKAAKNAIDISNIIEIISVGNEVIFKSLNESVTFIETFTDPNHSNKNSSMIVQGKYSTKHILDFSKIGSLCKKIELNMKNKYPLILKIKVGCLGKMYVILAPYEDNIVKDGNRMNH
mgnify:CR=1 FL=1